MVGHWGLSVFGYGSVSQKGTQLPTFAAPFAQLQGVMIAQPTDNE